MKNISAFTSKSLLAACVCLANHIAYAHDVSEPKYNPSSHAPAGVMSDHMHSKGEWMIGYRSMSEDFSGLQRGSDNSDSMQLSMAGYSMMPTSMHMEMHMLDIMFALSDNLTLMLMPQTMQMDMRMTMVGPDHADHMAGTGMDGMDGMDMDAGHGSSHSHSVSGLGDTVFGGLLRLRDMPGFDLHATLAVSAPTGSVNEKNSDGTFVHYGMQLGSGTWDLIPSLTYTGAQDRLSWGAQASARLPMESENESGYQLGELYGFTAWSAWQLSNWASVSARVAYSKEGDINGHYNGAHNHSSPADRQPNYGGELLDFALGTNLVAQQGALSGVRLGIEWQTNISGYYNGYQLAREDGLNVSLSYAF